MKNVLKVFKRDLFAMLKNPITMLIIGGLCIVPSLYSFLNVIGCWDAYNNTSTLPIAIVNEDTGASIAGKNMNVGNSIVDNLKTNKLIDWCFVSPQEGNIGLASGKYFSELIIPKDFSSDLSTLASSKPIKPELIYKVNTKSGPVANKITEVAQQNLLVQIKSSIMSTVSSQLFTKLNTYSEKANANKAEIINLKNSILNLNQNMGCVLSALNSVNSNSSDLNDYLNNLKATLPTINTGLSEIQNSTNNISNITSNTQNVLNTTLNNIELNLNSANSTMNNIVSTSNNLKINSNDKQSLEQILSNIDSIQNYLNTDINFLNGLSKSMNSSAIDSLLSSLKSSVNSINNQKANVQDVINNGTTLSASAINLIQSSANNASNAISSTINTYNDGAKSDLSNIGSGLISATNGASTLIGDTKDLNGKIQSVLSSASSTSSNASITSASLESYLKQYKGLISSLSSKLSQVSDTDVNKIVGLLEGSPVVMSDFASSPFNFTRVVIDPVANYGSGMTPVYSVLAFWVGMLLAGSLLKTEPPKFEGVENMTIREKHFGKMLTFIFIAIVQSLIITIGAKFLVGVQVANLPLFILGSLVTSITFAIIIFTILSLFGHIGDGICIVLMVIQLSGTGGTYPVQAMPLFFRIVEPFVPFPYGVNLMREAIGGPYWPNTFKYIAALVIFSIVFILIGYFFKPKTYKYLHKFEEDFIASNLAEE